MNTCKSILSSLLEKVVVRKLFDEHFSVKTMMNIELSNKINLKLPKNILNFASKEALQKIENLSDEKLIRVQISMQEVHLRIFQDINRDLGHFLVNDLQNSPLLTQKEPTRSFFEHTVQMNLRRKKKYKELYFLNVRNFFFYC